MKIVNRCIMALATLPSACCSIVSTFCLFMSRESLCAALSGPERLDSVVQFADRPHRRLDEPRRLARGIWHPGRPRHVFELSCGTESFLCCFP